MITILLLTQTGSLLCSGFSTMPIYSLIVIITYPKYDFYREKYSE